MSEANPSHTDLYRQIGLLEGKVESARRDISQVQQSQADMASDVKAMKSQLDEAKGGRTYLFGLLAAAGTLGALVSHVFGWIRP